MMPKRSAIMLDKIQDQLKPSVENPYFISKLIKDSNSNDEIRSMQALMLLVFRNKKPITKGLTTMSISNHYRHHLFITIN